MEVIRTNTQQDQEPYKKLLEICWSHEANVEDFRSAASEVIRLVSNSFVLLTPTLAILAIQAGNADVLGHILTGIDDSGSDIGNEDGSAPKQPSILEAHPDVLRAVTRLSDPSLLLLLISTKLLRLESPESWTNQLNASVGKSADLVSALLVLGALPNLSTFYRAALLPPSGAQLDTWHVLLDFQVPTDPAMIVESGCLAVAASRGRSDVVELLLDRGIPGLSIDSTGMNHLSSGDASASTNVERALWAAVHAKQDQMVKLLLGRGAGARRRAQEASETLDWAREQGPEWQGVVKLLEQWKGSE